MKYVRQNVIDDTNIVEWCTDSDFEYSAEIGDFVSVCFHDHSQDIVRGRIVDIFSEGMSVNNGCGSVVIVFFDHSGLTDISLV